MELFRRLSFAMVLLTLVGCGGGDGGLSNGETTTPALDVEAQIGISGPTTFQTPAEVTINIKENGNGVANASISLSINDSNLANFESDATSVTTDSNGDASILLISGNQTGEGEITLTYRASNGEDFTYTLPFTNAGGAVVIQLALSNAQVSNAEPATVQASVTFEGEPYDVLVAFTVDDAELANFNPENGRVLAENGIATIELLAGSKAGAGQVVASVISPFGEQVDAGIYFESAGDGQDNSSGPAVAEITLYADTQQLASSGAQEVVLTAIAKDINNILLSDVDVSFFADSGDILISTSDSGVKSSTTNESGQASAILRTQGNPENRTIEVTAQSGTATDNVNVFVVGTSIQFSGSSSLALNDENSFILNVLNSDSEGIADVEVSLSLAEEPADGIASLTFPNTVTTNPEGQAVVTVVGNTGGVNTLLATALGATSAKDVSVQADSFLFTDFDNGNGVNVDPNATESLPDVLLSDVATVTLTWNRSNAPVADGTVVEFSTTRGTLSASSGVVTDGQVSVTLNSTDAGRAIVTFTGQDGDTEITNQLEFEFVAETVDRLIAQASPNSIGPDGQTSTISVVARDANGNLVKNKTIVFSLNDTSGGTIFPAEAITDSNGSASTVYTSNTVSAQDDVSITATVKDQPSISDLVTLTVADRELFIALGTGNEIQETNSGTTYTKQFVAFVTDADSNPVTNQRLTISAVPEGYYKGLWVRVYENGEFVRWEARHENTISSPHYCTNEDTNLDGILDPGEDTNNDGSLTPGNVIASLISVSVDGDDTAIVEAVTDDEGKVLIDLVYAQSYGHWVDINLIVSGKVTGSESSTQTTYTLPVSGEDISDEEVIPPAASIGTQSPFGLTASCSVPD